MLAFACRMLNGDNDNFFGRFVDRVMDEIRIVPRHQLANVFDLLQPSDLRKQNKVFEVIQGSRRARVAPLRDSSLEHNQLLRRGPAPLAE
jgi:hypothetical protein